MKFNREKHARNTHLQEGQECGALSQKPPSPRNPGCTRQLLLLVAPSPGSEYPGAARASRGSQGLQGQPGPAATGQAVRGRDFICKRLSIPRQMCFTSGRGDGARGKEALEKSSVGLDAR